MKQQEEHVDAVQDVEMAGSQNEPGQRYEDVAYDGWMDESIGGGVRWMDESIGGGVRWMDESIGGGVRWMGESIWDRE